MAILAFSTNAYTLFTLPDACDRIAAAGYKAVEILADAPHAFPLTYSDHEAQRLRERLTALGLRPVAVNGNTSMGYFRPVPEALTFEPSLISVDEVYRQDRIGIIRRTLALANRLGSPLVTITGGQPLSGEPREVLWQRLLSGLEVVVQLADRAGIDLAFEPEPGQLIETTADLKRLLDEVDHPRLGANLDVGHAWCAGDDPVESIRVLGRRIKHLHLEDIKGRRHYHLIPGEGGEIDFAGIRRALDEVGFTAAAAVELYTYKTEPDRAATESYRILAPVFA